MQNVNIISLLKIGSLFSMFQALSIELITSLI